MAEVAGLGSSKCHGWGHKKKKKKKKKGVPVVVQWVKNPTISKKMQVRSLASLSGLRSRYCHKCGSQMWLRSGVAVAVT